MPKPKTKNDIAWEKLFEKYRIPEQISEKGLFRISAEQIHEFREPRLMAKFDHRINLPQVFAEHSLAILPVSRGDYVISHFQAYRPFEATAREVERAALPARLQSLDAGCIPSEAIAINCALASGILADFLGEKELTPTVCGRMGSARFDFRICNAETGMENELEVKNSQIEIDAAFEGETCLALLEAKLDLAEDFLVRQLYYPYRVWSQRVEKRVRPVFLVYSNGVFHLYEYQFADPALYNSLRLVQQKNYALEDCRISRGDLLALVGETLLPEPEIPFPQADRFERVVNLCELLLSQPLSREEVTEEYAFDIRQTNYYTDAGRYLGLIEKRREGGKPVYSLTEEGERLLRLPAAQRQLAFCRRILQHGVFRRVFSLWQQNGVLPGPGETAQLMRGQGLYHVSGESTYRRRASTVLGWLNWMLRLLPEQNPQQIFPDVL